MKTTALHAATAIAVFISLSGCASETRRTPIRDWWHRMAERQDQAARDFVNTDEGEPGFQPTVTNPR
jgi:hypothetical protein